MCNLFGGGDHDHPAPAPVIAPRPKGPTDEEKAALAAASKRRVGFLKTRKAGPRGTEDAPVRYTTLGGTGRTA